MKIAVRIYVVTKRMILGLFATVIALVLLGLALTLIFRSSPETAPAFERIVTRQPPLNDDPSGATLR